MTLPVSSLEVIFPARWTCVVDREEPGNAISVVQLAQIGRAGDDVVLRVVWIGAETTGLAQARWRAQP